MSKPFSIGQSKVKSYRQCHRQYHYKYVEELQRKSTKRPLMFGKVVHRMLEAHGQKEDPMAVLDGISFENEKLFTAEKLMYGELVEDIRTIMTEYFDYWDPQDVRWVPVIDEEGNRRYTEHEFAVPLEELTGNAEDRGIVVKGQVDGLVKTRNDLRWIGEHKTFDKLPGEDERWRNLQTIVYRKAILAMGWLSRVDGVFWNYIMSKPPTKPRLLKNGDVSAADIVTLPSVVSAFMRENKLEETDKSRTLMEVAVACRPRYFQRIFTPISTTVADRIFDGFVDSAREMRYKHGATTDQNIGRHCSWCDYEPICRAEITDGDPDFVKEREYIHEDPEAYRRQSREAASARKANPGVDGAKARGKHTPKLRVLR